MFDKVKKKGKMKMEQTALFTIIEKRGITISQLAKEIGISQGNISDWKSGKCLPSLNALIKIADYLNVSLDYLVGRTEETIGYERICCENCDESVIFHFKDSKKNDYALGLSTVLECITFAIKNGDLPKLPQSWLSDIDSIYNTDYAYDKDISYFDSNFPRKRE